MQKTNNSIKCKITNCKHQDVTEYCKLNSISVAGHCDCKDKKGTECQSFELS